MAIFDFLKKKEPENYSYSKYNQDDYWEKPEFDYAPETYNNHYPRKYPMTSYAMIEDGVVFSRDVKDYLLRDLIKRIIFTDAPFPEGYKLVDLSLDQDRSILGWNQTINDELCLVISTGEKGKGIELNRACNMMFAGFFELESIEWNNIVSSKEVRSMRDMFDGCQSLKSINLSCFDVSNVKYMSRMFSACKSLENIDWFRFSTANVEDVSHMFTNCLSLKSVNLSGFDTSSLKSCRKMFNKCGVKAVNLGNWYPTSPEQELNTEGMFNTTGLLSVLTTSNPLVQKEYLNLDEATRECQEENDIPRKIVPVSDWKVPTYSWEKEAKKSRRTDYQVDK